MENYIKLKFLNKFTEVICKNLIVNLKNSWNDNNYENLL